MSTVPFIALTLLSLPFLLLGEARTFPLSRDKQDAGDRPLTWLRFIAKPLASLGFLGVGWVSIGASGGFNSMNTALMVALVLCALGDICLLGTKRPLFLAGLVSFLLGHVGYIVVFALHGLSVDLFSGAVLVALLLVAWRVHSWLKPTLPPAMKGPVAAYIAIITGMMTAALAAWLTHGVLAWVVGGVLFYVSDLFVARNRFVKPGAVNRVVGLPLYYAGQLVLAASLAGD